MPKPMNMDWITATMVARERRRHWREKKTLISMTHV
jgi:hypothetical protein